MHTLCILMGYCIIIKVLLEARNKYDGTRRSPWNEVECGDHYTRPMAGFLLFEIASGQVCISGLHASCVYSTAGCLYNTMFIGSNGMYKSSLSSLLLD